MSHRKYAAEMDYWRRIYAAQRPLARHHFEAFFTTHFGLDASFFRGKSVLDVGCGPRGSLEWADGTVLRVGADPLAALYREVGTREHRMRYVSAVAERLPFCDGAFDIVSSFNSLDHVDNPMVAIAEIARALAPGGHFLLLTEIHRKPTRTEPAAFSWDIATIIGRYLNLAEERRYEKADPRGMYDSIIAGVAWNPNDPSDRYGVLSAKFVKPMAYAS